MKSAVVQEEPVKHPNHETCSHLVSTRHNAEAKNLGRETELNTPHHYQHLGTEGWGTWGGTEHGSTGGMAGSLPDQSSQVCGATMGMDNKREKQRDRQGREMVSGMTDFFFKLIMWKLISGKKIKIKSMQKQK